MPFGKFALLVLMTFQALLAGDSAGVNDRKLMLDLILDFLRELDTGVTSVNVMDGWCGGGNNNGSSHSSWSLRGLVHDLSRVVPAQLDSRSVDLENAQLAVLPWIHGCIDENNCTTSEEDWWPIDRNFENAIDRI